MNTLIDTLNLWSAGWLAFAGQMLWQSSLLIAVLFAVDFALRRKVRAAVRHALWLVLLIKLVVPPTVALPTGLAWWLRSTAVPINNIEQGKVVVTYGQNPISMPPSTAAPIVAMPASSLSASSLLLVGSTAVSLVLLGWLLIRWLQVSRDILRAKEAVQPLLQLLDEARSLVGLSLPVRLRLTSKKMSPAVCGLFHPVILLPETLAANLSYDQLRAVLVHELAHVKRGDVWANCLQTLGQVIFWWQPLLWLANARIRHVREEAVDDAVMVLLRDEADCYAPTLLEVAKLAFTRPLASLGIVGILESRSALGQRIERLIDFKAPSRAGLSFISLLGIAAFTAVAVPMGEPSHGLPEDPHVSSPVRTNLTVRVTSSVKTNLIHTPEPQINIRVKFVEMPGEFAEAFWKNNSHTNTFTQMAGKAALSYAVLSPAQMLDLIKSLQKKTGVDELWDAQITMLSARQAKILFMDAKTVVIGMTNGSPVTKDMRFGPVLDVIPSVQEDGYTIQMRLNPQVTEFLGYEDGPSRNLNIPGKNGAPPEIIPLRSGSGDPVPRFRLRELTIDTSVFDGGTVVLGHFKPQDWIGQNRQSPIAYTQEDPQRNLLVLVTATLLDPAGNRIHADNAPAGKR